MYTTKPQCQLYYSARFTIVLRCAYVQAPVHQGPPIFLPKLFFYDKFLLMWCSFKISTIPKFPEHVCLTCLCRPTGSTSFRAQVSGFITLLAQGLICPKSGTVLIYTFLNL